MSDDDPIEEIINFDDPETMRRIGDAFEAIGFTALRDYYHKMADVVVVVRMFADPETAKRITATGDAFRNAIRAAVEDGPKPEWDGCCRPPERRPPPTARCSHCPHPT